jgi:thiol-disulfide isomerase/thioredoxin
MRPFGCNSFDGTHEFMLPPGEYKVTAYASETDTARATITIAPGEKERTVELDMPPSRVAQLIGRPAPELAKINGWKNGGPVTLADLKGKVVLLDFWGHWCGPCVHGMPELMELYDEHKNHGFVVIAVHDDSVESIAEMDEKLAEIRKSIWKGRDLPFLVALDGGGPTPIRGTENTARGATTAAYGITGFPTQVLIGRDGRFAGYYRPKLLAELLAAPVPK